MLIPKEEIIGFITNSITNDAANWREVSYAKSTIIFNESETIEKLYFVKQGTTRLFKLDKQTNVEHTVGFVFSGEAYVPLSALSNWCPAMAGMQVIEKSSSIIEINIRDWQKLMGKDEKQIEEMKNYAISIAMCWINEFIAHYVCEQARNISFKEYYAEMKAKNNPVFSNHIDTPYLASYFQLNKKFLERIKQEYIKEHNN